MVVYVSINEVLVWQVYNRMCTYAHQAVKDWDGLMDSEEPFLVMPCFPDFIADLCEDYWNDWVRCN
jgi:hypothetical protein